MKILSVIKVSILFILASTVIMMSCTKKLDEAYTNPNSPPDEPVENIFPSLIGSIIGSSAAAGSAYGIAGDGIYIGRYIQYWNNYVATATDNGGTQYDKMGGVLGSSDAFGSMWAAFYFGHGQNLNYIVSRASSENQWDFVGGARALRGWGWLELGNEYANAIIIKQAFDVDRSTFDYDSLQLAYDSCRAACFDALAAFNKAQAGSSSFKTADAYFNQGDIQKWQKFTYGILARSYAYLSNKSDYSADSVIKYATLAAKTNADNTTVKFSAIGTSGSSNYYGPFRGNVGSLRQSAYIADLLSGRNQQALTGIQDPRAWYFLRENKEGTFYGVTIGEGLDESLPEEKWPTNFWGKAGLSTSSPATDSGRYIFRDNAEFPIMTASEMQFLLAEAYYRKGDRANALSSYKNAINLNFDMLSTKYATNIPSGHEINTTNKAAYMNNPIVIPTLANDLTLSQIMMQKYIALYGWGIQETWADMRRFHYTDKDPVTGKQIYAAFKPGGGDLFVNNNGKYVYRARPRYNSEYLYDIPSLKSVGAVDGEGSQVVDYHTMESWFSKP